ncbi:MAG TPA: Panacea domain-containing protein [Longimicrobium sp.]|jgi:uncharacterized phage-associated protein
MGRLSKDAEVLGFFIQDGAGIGHTRLVKLAYLADLESRKLLGRPITSWSYRFHHHGPFDSSLYSALKELADAGMVTEAPVVYPEGKVERQVRGTGEISSSRLSEVEKRILAHVRRTWASAPLDELLAAVYATEPMRQAVRGKAVPMHLVNNAGRDELGFDLDEVMAARRDAERGDYLTAAEFFDALRAEVTARHAR